MTFKVIFVILIYLVKIRSDDTESSTAMHSTKSNDGGGGNLDNKPAWSYINGTEDWCDISENCCGKSQSPINIKFHSAIFQSSERIEFNNYEDDISTFTIQNKGHTVLVNLKYDGPTPSISGGGLNGTYNFSSFHFRWGTTNKNGAEHLINNVGSPFEIQVVHFNAIYSSLAEALENPDGVVILAMLGEVDESEYDNRDFDDVIKNLPKIKYRGQSVTLKKKEIYFALNDLLPYMIIEEFFRYSGSFTMPGCQESVTWMIFVNAVMLSEEQIQEFRNLYSNAKDEVPEPVPLTSNVRPIQELNHRDVYRVETLGSIKIQHSSFLMLTAGLIISCLY